MSELPLFRVVDFNADRTVDPPVIGYGVPRAPTLRLLMGVATTALCLRFGEELPRKFIFSSFILVFFLLCETSFARVPVLRARPGPIPAEEDSK